MRSLQKTAEWLLGIPPSGPGEGTAWRYGQYFPWAGWVLLLFVLLGAMYVIAVYRRDAAGVSSRMRFVLVSLRLSVIGLLLFMLSQAFLSIDRTGLPYVVVVLDVSGSMTVAEPYQDERLRKTAKQLVDAAELGDVTPLNVGKAVLTQSDGRFLKQLIRSHKLRVYKVAGTSVEMADCISADEIDDLLPKLVALEKEGNRTRLGKGLRTILNDLRGTPPSAVILLTDGITTEGEKLSSAAEYARSRGVALFPVGLGDPEPVRDMELTGLQVDDVAFVNDPITFFYTLTGRGYAGKTATVSVRKKESGRALTTKKVKIGAGGHPQKMEITYTPPETGEFDYIVQVESLAREANTFNNHQTRHVSVRKEKIRVLLVDSVPRFEFRYLKTLLERDRSVELKTVLQDADAEFAQEDLTALPHFPATAEDLMQYDVVLFGDVNPDFLSGRAMQNLHEFVAEKSGGLLMIAGEQYNPMSYRGTSLEGLLPVELADAKVPPPNVTIVDAFQPQLTLEGRKGSGIFRFTEDERESFAVWNRLPGLYWFVETPTLKRGALAFATHPVRMGARGKLPIISMHRLGGGKVIFHATDETWRWRFRTGDLYYGRYWVQVIRYLSRARLLGKDRAAELTTDRREYVFGNPVRFRVHFFDERLAPPSDDGVTVVVRRQGGEQRKVTLSRVPQAVSAFEGVFSRPAEGTYHAFVAVPAFKEAPPSTDFRVTSPPGEMRTVRMETGELKRAAELTHGKYHSLNEAEQLLSAIPRGQPVPLETNDPVQLWNHWLTMCLLVGLLACEWILRKRLRLL